MQVVYETCLTRIEKKKWRASSPTIAFRSAASVAGPPAARPSRRPLPRRAPPARASQSATVRHAVRSAPKMCSSDQHYKQNKITNNKTLAIAIKMWLTYSSRVTV